MFASRTTQFSSINFVVTGQAEYTTPGIYSWTAPDGVTSVCVVCIGGGGGGMYWGSSSSTATYAMSGGGGGGLAWVNDIPVVPGNNYTVEVGAGGLRGAYSTGSTAGGRSLFIDVNTCRGYGGNPGRYNTNVSGGSYYVSTSYGTYGGGNGGGTVRTSSNGYGPAGGGGAGGYLGNGGAGRDSDAASGNSPAVGSGGGAGGGASSVSYYRNHTSGGGGGVGIYGLGADGVPSVNGTGGGGSGGTDGIISSNVGQSYGGNYGGGGGGSSSVFFSYGGDGGGGAVRIIWGAGRAFPSTLTEDL